MRKYFLFMLIVSACSHAQNQAQSQDNELKIYPNGLLYDQATMKRLSVIVDSLNLKFRSCDLSHPYHSLPQGYAVVVDVPNRRARKMIQEQISPDEYSKKVARAHAKKTWVIRYREEDRSGVVRITYEPVLTSGYWSEVHVPNTPSNIKSSGWVLDEDGERAIWLEQLKVYELPFKFSRLVQYVDCMIDTTATIYTTNKREYFFEVDTTKLGARFARWVEGFPNMPRFEDTLSWKNCMVEILSLWIRFMTHTDVHIAIGTACGRHTSTARYESVARATNIS